MLSRVLEQYNQLRIQPVGNQATYSLAYNEFNRDAMHTPEQSVRGVKEDATIKDGDASRPKTANAIVGTTKEQAETDEYRMEMERMITRTARTVRRLLEAVGGSPDEKTVDDAEGALRSLRTRIKHEGMRHQLRNEEMARLQSMLATTDDTQSRIDQAIIDARVTAGDLGMTRDSLARDVVRAKRALGALDLEESSDDILPNESSKEIITNGLNNGASRRQSHSRISSDDYDVVLAPLHRQLAEEIKNLKMTELQLVNVVDEINRVKKIRAELRRKMKDAEREW